MAGLPSGEFYLLSTSRDPDQFWIFCPPKILLGHLLDLFVQPKSFENIFWIFCPHQIFLGYPSVLCPPHSLARTSFGSFLSGPNLSRISFGFFSSQLFFSYVSSVPGPRAKTASRGVTRGRHSFSLHFLLPQVPCLTMFAILLTLICLNRYSHT